MGHKYKGKWKCSKLETQKLLYDWCPQTWEVTFYHHQCQLQGYELLAQSIVSALELRISQSVLDKLLESGED